MAKQIIYWGEFRSVAGTLYRVEILSDDKSYTAQRVYFPYDTPIEIEWNEVDKLEPVQGACLTLSLESKTDRQFIDLYSIEVGKVRVDVYREGALYWSGTLDPELYEEPYSEKKDYDVSFSFSDFAPLDRKKWTKTGICSIQEVIDTCLSESGINYTELVKYISTSPSADTDSVNLSEMYVVCDNFYDEEGEAMTLREVLDETLRPFALRMVQKGGKIYLYDLNAIHYDMETEEVYWNGTDAQLGVDKVYNNVTVTFSPYANDILIDGELEHDDISFISPTVSDDFSMDTSYEIKGFSLSVGEQEGLPLTLSNGAQFFKIYEEYSGNDEAGVIWACKRGARIYAQEFLYNTSFPRVFNSGKCISQPIITTKSAFLGYMHVPSRPQRSIQLRINLDVLFDVRYNPFESASENNEEGDWKHLQDWCNFGYVPVMLYLKDAKGNILYHYYNKGILNSNSYVRDGSNSCWVAGPGQWGDMFLAYYNKDDRKSASGFGGWQSNKMMCGYYRGKLPKKWSLMEDGEYINLPPESGFLELQIGSGIHQFDYWRETKDIYSDIRWLMYKNPIVSIVDYYGKPYELEDIEDKAWINVSAKEELNIDTIFGTLGKTAPSAKGLILNADYRPYETFCRTKDDLGNKRPQRLEHLLINTVYSQYATRNHTLNGTARILPDMKILTDASSQSKYVMLSEIQDLMQDTSEILISEFAAEHYEGVKYE